MTELSFRKEAHRLLLLITLLMVISDVSMLLFTRHISTSSLVSAVDLSERWYVTGNFGLSDEPISGEVALRKNSVFSVLIKIPEESVLRSRSCINFISYACAFDLLVDDRIVYSYGKDRLSSGKMIPRSIHYVWIPEDSKSKNVKIVFVAGKDGATVNPDSSYFGDVEILARQFTQKRGYAFILCAFLITFGIMLIVLCIFLNVRRSVSLATISQGLLLIALGVYISCYNDTFYYVLRNDVACAFIEQVSLMSLPFLMQCVLISNRRRYVNPLHVTIAVLDFAVIIAGIILHFTDIRHINTISHLIHMLIVLHGIYTFIWIRYIIKKEKKHTRSYLYANASVETIDFGLMALLSFCLFNLFLWEHGIFKLDFLNSDVKGNFIILGSLIFSCCVIMGYFFHSLGIQHEKEIRQALTEAAYTDELTGIYNRAYNDTVTGKWFEEKWPCSILTLDLDGLKKINDSIGHEGGDRYIREFAEVLKDMIPDDAVPCRIGGDEFVVILKNYGQAAAEKVMADIFDAVEEHNKSSKMPIYYSYGCASSEEYANSEEWTINDLYRLSDNRMYEIKDEHHKQGKGGRS